MLGDAILAWATLIGTLLSLVGVGIAVWQIRRTAKAAEAAEVAATQARAAVSASVLLSELAGCIRSIEEIKAHLRSSRGESALLRVIDTRTVLVQFRSMLDSPEHQQAIQQVVTQLAELRDLLEGAQADRRIRLDTTEAIRALADSSDLLNEWLGKAKYLAKGHNHAS